jgi:hypothetical protein
VALPFILKRYLKAKKKKNYGNSNIFHHAKIYNLPKNPLKEIKILQRYYYNSIITNLKFQHKPKI